MHSSKTKKTLCYRLGLFANALSKLLFKDEFYLRRKIKPLLIGALRARYKSGFPVSIGGVQNCLLDPTFYFANWENFGQEHNSGFSKCVKEATRFKCFFDIGAHIGLYSIPIAKMAPKLKVVSFEPSQSNYNMLKNHIQLNKLSNITCYNVLVGQEKRNDILFHEDESGISAMNSLASIDKVKGYSKNMKSMIQLDSFCDEHNLYPDVMKIDVEGAEVQVLKGAIKIISKVRPQIFLSLHPNHIKSLGDGLEDITKFCNKCDYKILIDAKQTVTVHLS